MFQLKYMPSFYSSEFLAHAEWDVFCEHWMLHDKYQTLRTTPQKFCLWAVQKMLLLESHEHFALHCQSLWYRRCECSCPRCSLIDLSSVEEWAFHPEINLSFWKVRNFLHWQSASFSWARMKVQPIFFSDFFLEVWLEFQLLVMIVKIRFLWLQIEPWTLSLFFLRHELLQKFNQSFLFPSSQTYLFSSSFSEVLQVLLNRLLLFSFS